MIVMVFRDVNYMNLESVRVCQHSGPSRLASLRESSPAIERVYDAFGDGWLLLALLFRNVDEICAGHVRRPVIAPSRGSSGDAEFDKADVFVAQQASSAIASLG